MLRSAMDRIGVSPCSARPRCSLCSAPLLDLVMVRSDQTALLHNNMFFELYGKYDETVMSAVVMPQRWSLGAIMFEMLVGYPPFYSDDPMSTCRKCSTHIVNWRTHLKFPEEAKLSVEAKELISKLLCSVNQRLGSKGANEIKAHPWFNGIDWDNIYHMEAAFIPEVNDELDTQNFEKFEESEHHSQTSSKSGPWRKMLSSKDINFVGYTYKNFEIVNDYQVPGMAELKKKNTKSNRPTIKALFEDESETSETANQ
ncbi:hypothetical protein OROGR_025050 [Orobanche gracilis]